MPNVVASSSTRLVAVEQGDPARVEVRVVEAPAVRVGRRRAAGARSRSSPGNVVTGASSWRRPRRRRRASRRGASSPTSSPTGCAPTVATVDRRRRRRRPRACARRARRARGARGPPCEQPHVPVDAGARCTSGCPRRPGLHLDLVVSPKRSEVVDRHRAAASSRRASGRRPRRSPSTIGVAVHALELEHDGRPGVVGRGLERAPVLPLAAGEVRGRRRRPTATARVPIMASWGSVTASTRAPCPIISANRFVFGRNRQPSLKACLRMSADVTPPVLLALPGRRSPSGQLF